MASILSCDKARILRKQGKSLNEITKQLRIPKSTVRYWCRDIILTKSQQESLFDRQKMGAVMSAEKLRKKRIIITRQLVKEGRDEIGTINVRELKIIGSALYWAEGYRKGDGEFGFTNSDPAMIVLILKWLVDVCHINKERIHVRICINSLHQKRILEIQRYWMHITHLSINQFSNATFIRIASKKIYANPSEYFGTLRIKVHQSTNLRRKVLGWIEGLVRGT